jgi:hypothetical protein
LGIFFILQGELVSLLWNDGGNAVKGSVGELLAE